MKQVVEFCWLEDHSSLESGLKQTLKCSGQLLKKNFSSKELKKAIRAKEVTKLPLNLVNHLQINPTYLGPEIKILMETDDFIALHKPPFIHCHPLNYEDKDTLLNFLVLVKKWQGLLVNATSYDKGLLYRLDFETSGVVILAKNEHSFQSMRKNFQTEMKRKFYLAIVPGDFNQEGKWTHYLKASGPKGEKQIVFNEKVPSSFEATLTATKISEASNVSLVLIKLETGVRHQIRAQLSHLGFPIIGDKFYGGENAPRVFLHALRYEFDQVVTDPDAELFDIFFDLNRALKMCHDVLRSF